MTDGEDTFEHWYLHRLRLPAEDLNAWAAVLLTCPRNRDSQWDYPTADDWRAAVTTLGASGKPRVRAWSLAWRLCVEREGTCLLDRLDAIDVSNYVTAGGTLREARQYLAAVMTYARTPEGEAWDVWQRHEVSFDAARFGSYRQMEVSPVDLAWFVVTDGFTGSWDVQRIHRWRLERCPEAPWRVAAAYRLHGLSDVEVAGWEERRAAGQDVVAALEMLAALTGDTR